MLQTFGDRLPSMEVAEAGKDLIMHVSLSIDPAVLMGGDRGSFGPSLVTGDNFSLSASLQS